MKLSKIYTENRLLIFLVSVLIILIGLPVIILLLINKNMTTAAAWYDTGWLHRKTVSIENDSGSTLTDEDVLVSIDTASLIAEGKLQSNCNDLRFVDSDDSTLLDYWIEGGCNTGTTQVWVRIPSLPNGGKTMYMYYDNSGVTSGQLGWSGNFIILSSQSNCPTGWSRVTELDNMFLMGSMVYGTTGGTSTHAHQYTQIPSHTHDAGSLITNTTGAHTHQMQDFGYLGGAITYPYLVNSSLGWYSGIVSTAGDHTHTITGATGTNGSASGTTSSTSNIPPYLTMLFCTPDNSNIGIIPENSILLFESIPSTGYTRYSALDARFPMASSTTGNTGGSLTHTHTYSTVISHSHGVGSLATSTSGAHSHDVRYGDQVGDNPYLYTASPTGSWGSGKISTSGAHTHTITGLTGSTGVASATTQGTGNLPPYVDMIFASQNTDQNSFIEGSILITTENPPLGWDRYSNLDDKFPRGSSSYGETGGVSTHSHIYTEVPAHTHTAGTLSALSAGSHTHNLLFTTGQVGGPDKRAYGQNNPGNWYTGALSTAGDHAHTITGTTASAGVSSPSTSSTDNLPPYMTVIYSQRKDSQITTLGTEDSLAPNTPTAQTATPTSTTSITWNFTDNSTDEEGFKVYDTLDTLKVTCALPNISSCLESSLSENTEYTRKFTAYNSMGESEFSDTTSAHTKASNISISNLESTTDTVTMTSSTFSNDTVGSSGYYFDCASVGCDTGINQWIQTNSDQSTGLLNNTGYSFRVKNRNGDGVENTYSNTQTIWTKANVPTIVQGDITDTTVVLNGTGVNNLTQGSSGLYFDCITEDTCDGGINEWVSSDTDTVTGLIPDTQYEFKVKARNYDSVETGYSSNTISVYTNSIQPTIASISNATTNSLRVAINNQENPSTTLYLLEEVNTAEYVNSLGQLVIDPVWLTYTQLGESTGITVNSLDSNTEYTFRVKAKNQLGVETDFSAPESAYTRLISPTALTPENKTDSSITWKISSTETGYEGIKIYDSVGQEIKTCVGNNILECQETGLNPNSEYQRKFSIYSIHSESDVSSLISVTTNAQAVSISSITPLNYYEVSMDIDLGDNPIGTDLQIFEGITSKYYDSALGILREGEQTFSSTGDAITISGLSPNTEYSFQIRAIDSEGIPTSWSSSTLVTTYAQTPDIVSTTALSTSSGRLVINLKDNPVGTRISVLENSGQYITESGVFSPTEDIFSLSGDSIDITGLSPNTTYTLKVRAYNEDDVHTDWSSTLDLVTYIEQPTVEISDQTKDSITLTISGISNIDQGDSGIYVEDLDIWSKELTQTVTGLNPNTSYSFNVKTRNSNGIETSYVESESGYTLANIPVIAEISAKSTTSGTIAIDLENNPNGTKISILESNSNKYLTSSGVLTTEEVILDTTELEFLVNVLQSNTTYSFKVKAHNEENFATAWSPGSELTTLIQTPTISISNITNSSVQITASGLSNISAGDSGIYVESVGNWSKNLTQTVSNLNPNAQYTFRVRSRNSDGLATAYISSSSIYTLANIPSVSSVTKLSSNTARVYLDPNGNPSTTQFAIRDEISEQYINANGNLQENPVWQTYTQWGGSSGKYISGIEDIRQLGFQVKARNSQNIETSFSNAEYIGTGSVILNTPTTVSVNLKDDANVNLSSDPQLGIQDVRIEKDQYLLADLKVSFEQDRDWKDVVVDADIDNSKTVIKVEEKHGIEGPFTMYVLRKETNSFRLCPEAKSLDEVKSGCPQEVLLKGNFPQEIEIENNTVIISQAGIDGVYYWIADGLTGTGGMGETIIEDTNLVESPDDEENLLASDTLVSRVSNIVSNVAQNIVLGTTEIFDKTGISELSEEELNTAIATTTTVTVTVGMASTGFMQSFYLIFHFFNSIFNAIGFKGKRKPFGYVYDSVTKEPISNTVVRIYSKDKLVDTTVTNVDGMFLANLKEGKYTIKVKKGDYKFPSTLIKGTEDYPLKNIYKGEILNNKEESDLIVSIPLDKIELSNQKKFLVTIRSLLSGILTIGNILLFTFGILLIIYTYYKAPTSFNWYIILLYIPALYFLTRSIFGKTSIYGKVVDKNKKAISDVELSLVDKEFNEVVAKRVTDKKGRYRFVCKKGLYDLKIGRDIILSDIKIKKDGYILAKKISLN